MLNKTLLILLCGSFYLASHASIANTSSNAEVHTNLHLGVSQVLTGKAQDVPANLLSPTKYTTFSKNNWSGLVGLAVLKKVYASERYDFNYGVSMFYLFKQPVSGEIFQAGLFNNLGYAYTVQNLPVYLSGKTSIDIPNREQKVVVDVGVGPNIMKVNEYHESRINPATRPDNAFKKNISAEFSTTVGIGLRFNHVLGDAPVECGYRFFYLGASELQIKNMQFMTGLSTGSSYANALACTLVI
ncbi:MAG: hypothetical protein K0U52_09780 [Gammaproteobacteria bacterium]|nr:hypothetical protein [Gammaproteobacteria bacterium]